MAEKQGEAAVLEFLAEERKKAAVRRYFEEGLLAEAGAGSRELVASECVEQHIVALRSAFPDLQVRVTDLAVHGDAITGRFHWQGTHTGVFLTRVGLFPATGRRAAWAVIAAYSLAYGRLEAIQSNWDLLTLGLLQRLGFGPDGAPLP